MPSTCPQVRTAVITTSMKRGWRDRRRRCRGRRRSCRFATRLILSSAGSIDVIVTVHEIVFDVAAPNIRTHADAARRRDASALRSSGDIRRRRRGPRRHNMASQRWSIQLIALRNGVQSPVNSIQARLTAQGTEATAEHNTAQTTVHHQLDHKSQSAIISNI